MNSGVYLIIFNNLLGSLVTNFVYVDKLLAENQKSIPIFANLLQSTSVASQIMCFWDKLLFSCARYKVDFDFF